jgi:hypothetical protein
MKKLAILFALLGVVAGTAGAVNNGSVGHGQGIILPSQDTNPCGGLLLLNFDGSAENGYCWQYGGIVPPYYGAFAECYDPGNGVQWVGYWANYSTAPCGYFIAADTNGFGGCPFTNIAPGIGYPTGWGNVSAVWGPTQSIGIGAWFSGNDVCGIELMLTGVGYPCGPFDAYVWADAGGLPGNVLCTTTGLNPCPVATWPSISTHDFAICGTPVPVEQGTWGMIKNLYK